MHILAELPIRWQRCQRRLILIVSRHRVVEKKEGQDLAKQLNCAFTEASAKDNENVARIFELMVGEVEKCSFPLWMDYWLVR